MDKVAMIARYLLGLVFFVFGLNGFFGFLPPPEVPEGAAQAFMGGLAGTGYFFVLLKITETVSGALLLAGRYVPLALLLLAPVVVNIAAYHIFLDPTPQPLVIATLLVVCGIVVARSKWSAFKGVLAK
ncbi:MAG: DoxX family membrane protein [Thermoanaerobaculia bacterium]